MKINSDDAVQKCWLYLKHICGDYLWNFLIPSIELYKGFKVLLVCLSWKDDFVIAPKRRENMFTKALWLGNVNTLESGMQVNWQT